MSTQKGEFTSLRSGLTTEGEPLGHSPVTQSGRALMRGPPTPSKVSEKSKNVKDESWIL